MGKASRDKGKRGELSLSHELNKYGYSTERTAQHCGKTGEAADLRGLPHIHIECKRVERLDLYKAMEQAINDAREGEIPAVFHRRNRDYWKVTLKLEDFMRLYEEWEIHQHSEND